MQSTDVASHANNDGIDGACCVCDVCEELKKSGCSRRKCFKTKKQKHPSQKTCAYRGDKKL